MSTLTTSPVLPLLDRLFREADADDADVAKAFARLSPAERDALHADYRALYGGLAKDRFLAVSRETGRLLYVLARAARARTIVELGTSFGLSTIHLAAALRDEGGGRLVTTELVAEKAARARANLSAAGLSDLVEVRVGDALETLATDVPSSVDLVLLDGAKALYPRVLALLLPHLRRGALVVADNAGMSPAYLEEIRGPRFVSVAFGGDVEVSTFVG